MLANIFRRFDLKLGEGIRYVCSLRAIIVSYQVLQRGELALASLLRPIL